MFENVSLAVGTHDILLKKAERIRGQTVKVLSLIVTIRGLFVHGVTFSCSSRPFECFLPGPESNSMG